MRRTLIYTGSIVILGVAALALRAAFRVHASVRNPDGAYRVAWSPAAAAGYLDEREAWWQNWRPAQLEQGTVCVSCHTVLPYAFVRPLLRRKLGETEFTSAEQKMLSSIVTRVNAWPKMHPYYTDPGQAMPSHSTEAVLNAVILAAYSSEAHGDGNSQADPVLRRAFDNAWALQQTVGNSAGGWQWQDFHAAPWESGESAYQGAAIMAIAVGMTSEKNNGNDGISGHIEHLRDYLRRNYSAQPVMNQLYVLWASAEMPGLLNDLQREELIQKVARLENADGGWSLSTLDRQEKLKPGLSGLFESAIRMDNSDGCATGLAVLTIKKSGISSKDTVAASQRGLAWLSGHQTQRGSWWASSMNGPRDPSSGTGHFMIDAATGYAVLALEGAENQAAMSSEDAAETATGPAYRRPGRIQ